MLDRVLTAVIGSLLLAAVSLQILLMVLPVFRRIEFDAICHRYVLLMDQQGGLREETMQLLVKDLQDRQFTVLSIQASPPSAYGDLLHMAVDVSAAGRQLTPALTMEETAWVMTYEAEMICRMIKADAVP